MSTIGLSYTDFDGETHSLEVALFSGDGLPRTVIQEAKLEFSAGGAAIASGPARRQRRVWAISAFLSGSEANDLEELHVAWDLDRAKGLAAAVAITDATGFGDPVEASAWFSTAPSFSRAGPLWLASFGLTEV